MGANLLSGVRSLGGFLRKAMPGPAADPRLLFAHFQAVLENNNRSLEIITDMGEKLGGDYLFDANYTRGAYGALYESISGSIRNFSLLSDNRYPQLAESLARIDGLVRRMFDGRGLESGPLVVAYPDLTWDMAEAVGGKNSHLAEIGNALHLAVPPSFAVTTAAFDAFIAHNGLDQALAALAAAPDPASAAADLRAGVLAGEIPPALAEGLARATARIRERGGPGVAIAVRSSADEEDGDFSFAGQFASVLNVPCDGPAAGEAYREVLASLFDADAIAYQQHLGLAPGRLRMAVGGVMMVDARCSGVIFTVAAGREPDAILINAAWGLGVAVVDGKTDADHYTVAKGEEPRLVASRIGAKETMVVGRGAAGIETVATPAELRGLPCLAEAEALELARKACAIETYFKGPQDIEWAIDRAGRCYILQARGLRVEGALEEKAAEAADGPAAPCHLPVLLADQGVVVRKGAVAGKVFVLHAAEELDRVPRGAILVARHDSPHFVRVIPFLGAIVTDVGAPTSHMASICREFNVPTVVNAGNATTLLGHGEEVTLVAGDDNRVAVYAGIAHELLRRQRQSALKVRELYEFRRQKYIMRYIAPLNLVNPLEEEFAPEKCKTVHDLIRFMHEKSVQELVASATRQGRGVLGGLRGNRGVRRLAVALPMQVLAIDLGGGIRGGGRGDVSLDAVASVPLRALLGGMRHPGVWHDGAMALAGRDLLSGMARAGDFSGAAGGAGVNLAVISQEYVNMSMRFGYHYNMLDSYCSDKPRNNHIYFRFVGGAASITSRSRRVRMMARILGESGFIIKTTGDLLVARVSNLGRADIERILDQIGRLVAYTRQLDAILDSDAAAERLADRFLAGDYDLAAPPL